MIDFRANEISPSAGPSLPVGDVRSGAVRVDGPFPGWSELSAREREVLYWVAEGKTDKEIGQICGISHRTVQRHVQIVLQKLDTHTRTAAAATVWRSRLAGWRGFF